MDDALRDRVLREAGVAPDRLGAVKEYTGRAIPADVTGLTLPPLNDEPFLTGWRETLHQPDGLPWETLRQLLQPISRYVLQRGAEGTFDRGRPEPILLPPAGSLARPQDISVEIRETVCGGIPVVTFPAREDFECFLRALWAYDESRNVPATLGAMYFGRLAEFRDRGEPIWHRLIALSCGPYAGITARDAGMTEADWRDTSRAIRRTHELTHYCLRRMRGRIANNLTEEIVADYEACVQLAPERAADWLPRFLELGSTAFGQLPRFRTYLPPSLAADSEALARLAQRACRHLAQSRLEKSQPTTRLAALSLLTLEEMAAEQFELQLKQTIESLVPWLQAPA